MTSRAPLPLLRRAVSTLRPFRSFLTSPIRRPFARCLKRLFTLRPFSRTVSFEARFAVIATTASPPETMSARLESTSIFTAAFAGAAPASAARSASGARQRRRIHGHSGTPRRYRLAVPFLTPSPPPFDIEEWKQQPFLTRLKANAQDWAVNGFGTPGVVYLLYVVKLVIYLVGGLILIGATTPGLGGPGDFGDWWSEPIVFQKLAVWTL